MALVATLKQNVSICYRFFATGLGFLIFGFFGLIISLLLLIFYTVKANRSYADQILARKIVAFSWRLFSYYLVFSGVCEIKYEGIEKLGRRGQIILCNHPSLLDVVFLFSRISHTNIVVKKSLLKNPVMIGQIKSCGFILNEDISLDIVRESLSQEAILLFPEGTRTRLNEKIKLRRAAISLALHTAKIITHVKIKMHPENWKKGQKWWKIPPVRPKYEFIVGEDLIVSDYLSDTHIPIAARKLHNELENYFNQK